MENTEKTTEDTGSRISIEYLTSFLEKLEYWNNGMME